MAVYNTIPPFTSDGTRWIVLTGGVENASIVGYAGQSGDNVSLTITTGFNVTFVFLGPTGAAVDTTTVTSAVNSVVYAPTSNWSYISAKVTSGSGTCFALVRNVQFITAPQPGSMDVLTTSGTYTKTGTGFVLVVGGGGGGGGAITGSYGYAGGGGASGIVATNATAMTFTGSMSYTVGAQGNGVAGASKGNAGGQSSFGGVTAAGGNGGVNGTNSGGGAGGTGGSSGGAGGTGYSSGSGAGPAATVTYAAVPTGILPSSPITGGGGGGGGVGSSYQGGGSGSAGYLGTGVTGGGGTSGPTGGRGYGYGGAGQNSSSQGNQSTSNGGPGCIVVYRVPA